MRVLSPEQADEASLWQTLADALGYQTISTGRYPGSSGWRSTMRRPDGSMAEFAMEERELRAVDAALRASAASADEIVS